MPATLEEHPDDKMLYVVESLTSFSKPVVIRNWFPTGLRAADFASVYGPEKIGQALRYDYSDGCFVDADGRRYLLVNGRQTRSSYAETLPVPPPKCRQQTRWNAGRWEKLLTKGWKGVGV